MFDTVKMLIESSALPEVDFITENTNNFNMIREATENEILCTKFNPKKNRSRGMESSADQETQDGAQRHPLAGWRPAFRGVR